MWRINFTILFFYMKIPYIMVNALALKCLLVNVLQKARAAEREHEVFVSC